MKLPEVPAAVPLATQIERAQMEDAVKALPEPSPKGMRRIKKESVTKAKSKESEVNEAPPEPSSKNSEVKTEDTARNSELTPETPKEPVTQEKLSHGFAKLMRQQKAAEREDARIKAELAKLETARGEHDTKMSALRAELDKRQADIDELMKLFDEDADKFVDAIARKKNLKKEDLYDKWTRQRLNGGVPAPEDQIARGNSETEKLRKEIEELKAAKKAEQEELSKKTDEEKKQEAARAAVQAENEGFLKHVRESGKYPLLAAEQDNDIVNVARRMANGQPVTYEQIAAYLERQLSFQKWEEEQAGKAKSETPTESAPAPKGQKAESQKTLTNKMASTQTAQAPSTRRNEYERIEDLVDRVWK